ncbi:hypothetical protein [Azospirillum sp. B506]|uniref:hypothetical protein n=1 Tax=Azospirillum sp. B506 TaxID=137721 RepID=UPI00034BDF11|nr:hypothetical protein [Azospirillum sp. B506]
MRKRPTLSQMNRTVERFNRDVPIGSAVKVRKDSGEVVQTVTASEAYVLSGHTPVIFLRGISGCYALDRVTPASIGG